MLHTDPVTARGLARHRDLLREAEHERRLALALSARPARPNPAAALRRAIAGGGNRRATPSMPTTASATT